MTHFSVIGNCRLLFGNLSYMKLVRLVGFCALYCDYLPATYCVFENAKKHSAPEVIGDLDEEYEPLICDYSLLQGR